MCVMSKNPCLSMDSFSLLSCFSHSMKSMTLRGNVEIRKVEGFLVSSQPTPNPNKEISSVTITVDYLSQSSRFPDILVCQRKSVSGDSLNSLIETIAKEVAVEPIVIY